MSLSDTAKTVAALSRRRKSVLQKRKVASRKCLIENEKSTLTKVGGEDRYDFALC